MKTINSMAVIVMLIVLIIAGVKQSKQKIAEVKTACQQSTHQGYRSMVAEFVF